METKNGATITLIKLTACAIPIVVLLVSIQPESQLLTSDVIGSMHKTKKNSTRTANAAARISHDVQNRFKI
jgi:ABC-type methionine transport system permease subunit